MLVPRTTVLAALLCLVTTAAHAQSPDADMQAGIAKTNAYIELMNRTLRAQESWNRYASWANVKTGPTGKERIVYGLYSLYDVRELIEKARAAAAQPPAYPALDETVKRYIAAYEVLAPLVTEADGYYERKDYMSDKMAGGKALHAKLAPAAQAFLTERKALERDMEAVKSDLDRRQLAAIEQSEGRKARYHVQALMIHAKRVLRAQDAEKPDLAALTQALNEYEAVVKAAEQASGADGGAKIGSMFISNAKSFLTTGKQLMRRVRDKVPYSQGDRMMLNAGSGWMVEGSPQRLLRDYNQLIDAFNRGANI